MVNAALSGILEDVSLAADPNFGVLVPKSCPNVPLEVLSPRDAWSDPSAYDNQARELTKRFESNFKQFERDVDDSVKAVAIHGSA